MHRWIAVYTTSAAQGRVILGMHAAEIEVFCPFERYYTTGRWTSDRVIAISPIFPNYVFAKVAPERTGLLKQIDGVVSVLRSEAGKMIYAPDEEIDIVRRARDLHLFDRTATVAVEAGTPLKIVSSALAGVTGAVKPLTPTEQHWIAKVRSARPRKRIELIGQFGSFRVTAPLDRLEKVKA